PRREERDDTERDRQKHYSQHYLAPLNNPKLRPRIGLNGEEPGQLQLVDSWEEAVRLEHELSGNLLSHESSREFVELSADELAVRVLAGYSEFAEKLETFVEAQVDRANQGRQTFLRGLGLSSMITRVESASERIAEQGLSR